MDVIQIASQKKLKPTPQSNYYTFHIQKHLWPKFGGLASFVWVETQSDNSHPDSPTIYSQGAGKKAEDGRRRRRRMVKCSVYLDG